MTVAREYQADGWRRLGMNSLHVNAFGVAITNSLWEHRDGHQEWREYSRRQLDAAKWLVLQ